MSRKIGRRSVQRLAAATVVSRRLLVDAVADLMPTIREATVGELRLGLVSDRWVSWRPVGPITEYMSEPPDMWMRNEILFSVKQPWETRFVGRRRRRA